MNTYRALPALLALLAAAPACDSPAGPDDLRGKVGILEWVGAAGGAGRGGSGGDTPPPIVAPDTVRAGTAFQVQVNTIGPSGCWRAGDTRVTQTANEVTITPYDVHSGAEICTMALVYLPHKVSVTMPSAGEGVIRASGRRVVDGREEAGEPVSVTKRVVVLPR